VGTTTTLDAIFDCSMRVAAGVVGSRLAAKCTTDVRYEHAAVITASRTPKRPVAIA
jgi:hypothetical protein